jgi:TRAP-type C4-dicarboxylate transport system permease small subunit
MLESVYKYFIINMCIYRKIPFVGMTDWAVNIVALNCLRFNCYIIYFSIKYANLHIYKSSILFLSFSYIYVSFCIIKKIKVVYYLFKYFYIIFNKYIINENTIKVKSKEKVK